MDEIRTSHSRSRQFACATALSSLQPVEVHDRLALATDRSPGAATLRGRLRAGTVSLYPAHVLHDQTRHLPGETAALEVIDAVLRPKDGAPPSPTLFRQRLTRACLADGLGVLTVTNDAHTIIAAMERADAITDLLTYATLPDTHTPSRAAGATDTSCTASGPPDTSDLSEQATLQDLRPAPPPPPTPRRNDDTPPPL